MNWGQPCIEEIDTHFNTTQNAVYYRLSGDEANTVLEFIVVTISHP